MADKNIENNTSAFKPLSDEELAKVTGGVMDEDELEAALEAELEDELEDAPKDALEEMRMMDKSEIPDILLN